MSKPWTLFSVQMHWCRITHNWLEYMTYLGNQVQIAAGNQAGNLNDFVLLYIKTSHLQFKNNIYAQNATYVDDKYLIIIYQNKMIYMIIYLFILKPSPSLALALCDTDGCKNVSHLTKERQLQMYSNWWEVTTTVPVLT